MPPVGLCACRDDTRPDQVSFGEFADWYVSSETRVKVDLTNKFKQADSDADGFITALELEKLIIDMSPNNMPPETEELENAKKELVRTRLRLASGWGSSGSPAA